LYGRVPGAKSRLCEGKSLRGGMADEIVCYRYPETISGRCTVIQECPIITTTAMYHYHLRTLFMPPSLIKQLTTFRNLQVIAAHNTTHDTSQFILRPLVVVHNTTTEEQQSLPKKRLPGDSHSIVTFNHVLLIVHKATGRTFISPIYLLSTPHEPEASPRGINETRAYLCVR
jgi:hypothetical protein